MLFIPCIAHYFYVKIKQQKIGYFLVNYETKQPTLPSSLRNDKISYLEREFSLIKYTQHIRSLLFIYQFIYFA